ncbi:MAG: DnaJ domain-containing protein [Pirellulaceae bacterium]|nr:DnaJ domain-containing protein [Pirellulaceae bacterium]
MPPINERAENSNLSRSARRDDPYRVLSLPPQATDQEVRERYLQLVREFPPERDAERFHEIRAAYEAASDPLKRAARLLAPPDNPPSWEEVLDEARRNPPRLSVELLLSLGNHTQEPPAPDA